MAAHTTRQPETLTSTELHPAKRQRRLIWLLALVAAAVAAPFAGTAVAEQLTRSSTVAPAVHHGSSADTPEAPGKIGDQESSSVAGQARPQPSQEYLWRPAYVRGKVVLIRIRADAANVREDRGISDLKP